VGWDHGGGRSCVEWLRVWEEMSCLSLVRPGLAGRGGQRACVSDLSLQERQRRWGDTPAPGPARGAVGLQADRAEATPWFNLIMRAGPVEVLAGEISPIPAGAGLPPLGEESRRTSGRPGVLAGRGGCERKRPRRSTSTRGVNPARRRRLPHPGYAVLPPAGEEITEPPHRAFWAAAILSRHASSSESPAEPSRSGRAVRGCRGVVPPHNQNFPLTE
jgi:hypothetical protein